MLPCCQGTGEEYEPAWQEKSQKASRHVESFCTRRFMLFCFPACFLLNIMGQSLGFKLPRSFLLLGRNCAKPIRNERPFSATSGFCAS